MFDIQFQKASLAHKDAILQWLNNPHMIEFWDTTPEHRNDIVIFMNGRKEKSPYYDGMFDYWVALIDDEPYSLIMTSIVEDDEDCKELWKKNLSKTGKTYSIDFCIGSEKFLGKSLAAPTLSGFTDFFHEKINRKADTFFIDPNLNNPRAKHIYEKAGFRTIDVFTRRNEEFYLMVKRMKEI